MSNLKRTALYEEHVKLDGKIVDFAGWELPIQYEGLVPEHEAVRNACGIFDVTHMGEVTVEGKEAEAFVQNLVCNNAKVLVDNQIMYALMSYEHGGIVDDLLVYKYNTEKFLLVINASNVDKDFAWMEQNAKAFDVTLKNISDEVSEVALQGPKAQALLQKISNIDLEEIPFFFFNDGIEIAGVKCIVSRTGYTGEDGFEIYTAHENIVKVWQAIFEVGDEFGLKACGLGCRDTLRFEAALPLYGNEINDDITVLEAGLSYFTKLDNDDFIGRDVLLKQKEDGIPRKLVGFELIDKGVPRHEYPVLFEGEEIGFVTTGYKSPTVGKTIGLALIKAEFAGIGKEFDVQIRKKTAKAVQISKKFYKKNYSK